MVDFEYVNQSAIDVDVKITDTHISVDLINNFQDYLKTIINFPIDYRLLIRIDNKLNSMLYDLMSIGHIAKYEIHSFNNHLIAIYKQLGTDNSEYVIINLPMETKYKIRNLEFRFPESSFCKLLTNSYKFGPISYFDNSICSLL